MNPQAGFFLLVSGLFMALWLGQVQKNKNPVVPAATTIVINPSELSEASDKAEYDEDKIVAQKQILTVTTNFFLRAHPELPNGSTQDWVEIDDLKNGAFLVRLSVPDLYPTGAPKISPFYMKLLREYAEILKPLERRYKVTGFTDSFDDLVIKREKKTNRWSLSTQRAALVAEDWERTVEIPHKQLWAEGLGHTAFLTNRKNTNPKRIEITVYK